MHILPEDIAPLPPFVCIVCEREVESGHAVDTLTDLEIDYTHHLEGRKYVCETCVTEMADLFGLTNKFTDSDLAFAQSKIERLTEMLDNAEKIVGSLVIQNAERVAVLPAQFPDADQVAELAQQIAAAVVEDGDELLEGYVDGATDEDEPNFVVVAEGDLPPELLVALSGALAPEITVEGQGAGPDDEE